MTDKYLLYLDLLGFGALVDSGSSKIAKLYAVLDDLNVHRHEAFTTIVFSDTVLIYNRLDPASDNDHQYLNMYSCEFVQDLMSRTAGSGLAFRAVLMRGDFRHDHMVHIEAFYGSALVGAYRLEKSLQCVGLFMHASSRESNKIFNTQRFDQDLDYVFVTQGMDSLQMFSAGQYPMPYGKDLIASAGIEFNLAWELSALYEIYRMREDPTPAIRAKYLAAWQMYEKQYPGLPSFLAEHDFHLSELIPEVDWVPALEVHGQNAERYGLSVVLPPI